MGVSTSLPLDPRHLWSFQTLWLCDTYSRSIPAVHADFKQTNAVTRAIGPLIAKVPISLVIPSSSQMIMASWRLTQRPPTALPGYVGIEMTCIAPLVTGPESLQDNAFNYDKGVLAEILEPIMGKGLIPADLETWKPRRRAIVPAFHKAYLEAMVHMFAACTRRSLHKFQRLTAGGQVGLSGPRLSV